MAVKLDDNRELLESINPTLRDSLAANFTEAARIMSPAGLHNYLEGARALSQLGRGNDLVASYIEEMPAVVKEAGEDVIKDCVNAALKLASMVSGEIISLLFATLPTAAPHLDELFGKLTLGGLRRWALWGAQAHGRDFQAQINYFNLASADALAVLQKERRGTLLVDQQRKLNLYLRALWARDFFLRPTSGDYESREGYKPFIEQRVIHLPDAYDDYAGIAGSELYRAAAAHAAAHLVYTRAPISAEALTPTQMIFIGLFEDARVEHLAIADFPGLKQLWPQFHEKLREVSCAVDPVVELLERAAYAMLDDSYVDVDPWVRGAAAAFRSEFAERPHDNRLSWDLGVTFYNELGGHHSIPSLRVLESVAIPYRDDNRYNWSFDEAEWHEAENIPASQRQVRKTVNVMEMVNEVDCELAGDDAQESWRLETPFYLDQEGVTLNELEGTEPVSEPQHYQEWDYQVQLHRPNWVTVLEKRQRKGDAALIDQTLLEHRPEASRLKQLIDAMQPRGVVRQRRQEDGDEIDINAALRAMLELRMGEAPAPRINLRHIRKTRDLAVLVLLDLSESTNEKLGGSDKPVLQLAREATTLLSWAIAGLGDPFAIHGFASDGRHDVQYFRFKDFDERYDDDVKARLTNKQRNHTTHMGGALRHAASLLLRQPQQKKLILLVSDGAPADIDVRDPQYLRADTKKAVEALAPRGITTYCLTLDPNADAYVGRIFGPNHYTVDDHVQRLPERQPTQVMGH